MRTQASKNVGKKTTLVKPKFKTDHSPTKQVKKKTVKTVKVQQKAKQKPTPKSAKAKKVVTKKGRNDESQKQEIEINSKVQGSNGYKSPGRTRSNSPNKKAKSDDESETSKKITNKKKGVVKKKPPSKATKKKSDSDEDVKYKLNKVHRVKAIKRKKGIIVKKKTLANLNIKKTEKLSAKSKNKEELKDAVDEIQTKSETIINEGPQISDSKRQPCELSSKDNSKQAQINNESLSKNSTLIVSKTPKTADQTTERPPKFFTSVRTPKIVDIGIKNFKTIKTSVLSLVEKNDSKAAPINVNLVKEQEIDVYTFTDFKADSPKNILSDLGEKKVGKVRPIARVKGTVIDRTADIEKKKTYKPIEDVINKLNIEKKIEDNSNKTALASADDDPSTEIQPIIVSKSYKMVPRKTCPQLLGGKLKVSKSIKPKTTIISKKVRIKRINQKLKCRKISISEDDIETSTFSFSQPNESSSDESSQGNSEETETMKRGTKKGIKTAQTQLTKKNIKAKKKADGESPAKLSKRRMKLYSMWTGPKRHRMASLNALAKVHCLYENESRTHVELGLMRTIDRPVAASSAKTVPKPPRKKIQKPAAPESTSESEYEKKSKSTESSDDDPLPTRKLRVVPGSRGAGKYWDPKSFSSSEESEAEHKNRVQVERKQIQTKQKVATKPNPDPKKAKPKKTKIIPVKKRRRRTEVTMDLKDMVVQKRMASLNATAILAASYEKRSPKSSKDETTTDSNSDKDETYAKKSKNVIEVKSESSPKVEDVKSDDNSPSKQKLEVIVNQDTDVTITGVYSTHHEGYCTVSGLKYRISSTSHTQTTATASSDKKEEIPTKASPPHRYTPLGALSSMQPPPEHSSPTHQGPEHHGLVGLGRRAGCSSAFTAPPSNPHHHEPGYYQPAGPLIKDQAGGRPESVEERRALERYHPHYHAPPVLPRYGAPYYGPGDLCYGGYYRPTGAPLCPDAALQIPPPPEAYPPQYYAAPPPPGPCYRHEPQRVPPYLGYRNCSCTAPPHPKNVHTGPVIGNPPAGGGPVEVIPASVGGAFRPTKARPTRRHDVPVDSGKDPPVAAGASLLCRTPHVLSGASPKREFIQEPSFGPEVLGPPSPARGSAGACLPQPPPLPTLRRARVGKAMARKSLVGDDTATLLTKPPVPPPPEMDDDVIALVSPIAECVPIDLSSSDEAIDLRDTPPKKPLVVDVKKENEEPIRLNTQNQSFDDLKKPPALLLIETQALKERNATSHGILREAPVKIPEAPTEKLKPPENHASIVQDNAISTSPIKTPAKRRFSRPKLEVELDLQATFDDAKPNNCIGEHVKLQKRRKLTIDTPIPVEQVEAKASTKASETVETKAEAIPKKVQKRKSTTPLEVPPTKIKKFIVTNRVTPLQVHSKKPEIAKDSSFVNNAKKPALVTPIKLKKTDSVDYVIKKCTEMQEKECEKKNTKLKLNPEATSMIKTQNHEISAVIKNHETVTPIKIKKVDILNKTKMQPKESLEKNEKQITKKHRSALLLDKLLKKSSEESTIDPANLFLPTSARKTLNINNNVVSNVDTTPIIAEPKKCKEKKRHVRRRKSSVKSKPADELVDPQTSLVPRWSNGWEWEGEPYLSKVYLNNDPRLARIRRCWASMIHVDGERVRKGDCILLRASARRSVERPYVARVARLFENDEREMMVSLLWYYRPEHTETGRRDEDALDEVFASKHRDNNSVACIEDKCYVLTYNEYCRYRKRLKLLAQGVTEQRSIVPPIQSDPQSGDARIPKQVPPELVLFCRRVYDFRSKKVMIPTNVK